MPTYEEIKGELAEIGKLLQQFPEALQTKVFDILIDQYLGKQSTPKHRIIKEKEKPEREISKKGKSTQKKPVSKTTFSLMKDLQLGREGDTQSFKDFVDTKQPSSNVAFNTVAIYYLTKIRNVSHITMDHIYTCYKNVSRRAPGNFKQSFHDASGSRYGYIDASDPNDLKMSHIGVTFVEDDLPKGK